MILESLIFTQLLPVIYEECKRTTKNVTKKHNPPVRTDCYTDLSLSGKRILICATSSSFLLPRATATVLFRLYIAPPDLWDLETAGRYYTTISCIRMHHLLSLR
jgi:hypothetical protein